MRRSRNLERSWRMLHRVNDVHVFERKIKCIQYAISWCFGGEVAPLRGNENDLYRAGVSYEIFSNCSVALLSSTCRGTFAHWDSIGNCFLGELLLRCRMHRSLNFEDFNETFFCSLPLNVRKKVVIKWCPFFSFS